MRRINKMSGIEQRLDSLTDLSRDELVAQWIKIYKLPPPKAVKRGLLERAVSYHLQAKHHGQLKTETHKALLAIASGPGSVPQLKQTNMRSELKPGTRLVREWHGATHQVNVTETGFYWDGTEYASLSAIAKAITGARWSGPRFFGL